MPPRGYSRGITDPKRVELLYFAGCPNYQAACKLVERIAAEEGVPIELELVEVRTPEEAELRRFLRVNGHDVEPGADQRDSFMLACRIYGTGAGMSGQPAEEWVHTALDG